MDSTDLTKLKIGMKVKVIDSSSHYSSFDDLLNKIGTVTELGCGTISVRFNFKHVYFHDNNGKDPTERTRNLNYRCLLPVKMTWKTIIEGEK